MRALVVLSILLLAGSADAGPYGGRRHGPPPKPPKPPMANLPPTRPPVPPLPTRAPRGPDNVATQEEIDARLDDLQQALPGAREEVDRLWAQIVEIQGDGAPLWAEACNMYRCAEYQEGDPYAWEEYLIAEGYHQDWVEQMDQLTQWHSQAQADYRALLAEIQGLQGLAASGPALADILMGNDPPPDVAGGPCIPQAAGPCVPQDLPTPPEPCGVLGAGPCVPQFVPVPQGGGPVPQAAGPAVPANPANEASNPAPDAPAGAEPAGFDSPEAQAERAAGEAYRQVLSDFADGDATLGEVEAAYNDLADARTAAGW